MRRRLSCFTLERLGQPRQPGERCPACKSGTLTTKPAYPEIQAICPLCGWQRLAP